MKFIVNDEVFKVLPEVCFGLVSAKGIDNTKETAAATQLLAQRVREAQNKFAGVKVKDRPEILPYREAFLRLGINPNKFLSSIEALTTRIAKGGEMPHINGIVDLANCVSLKYTLPLGAHDLDTLLADIMVRFSQQGDVFIPFGAGEEEEVPPGELVYASGRSIRTRRWIWRQSEEGKITPGSTNIFFPIDGFRNCNYAQVISARDELAELLSGCFDCQVATGFIDSSNRQVEF